MHSTIRPITLAIAATVVVIAWQYLSVFANFNGDFTGLYRIGILRPWPPSLEPVYKVPVAGYDGQYYLLIAHDPIPRGEIKDAVDEPRLRYRRILLPAIAALLSFGNHKWVEPMYRVLLWLCLFFGVWFTALLLREINLATQWAFAFLLLPAVIISADRMVADVALASFLIAALYFDATEEFHWLWVALCACAAVRETGLLILAAFVIARLMQRNWFQAILLSAAATPILTWYAFVQLHTNSYQYSEVLLPLRSIVSALLSGNTYSPQLPFRTAVFFADKLALIGMLAAIALPLIRGRFDATGIVAITFALIAAMVQRPGNWQHVFDYGRVYSPLLLALGFDAARDRNWILLLPWLLMLPRLAMEFGTQAAGIIHLISRSSSSFFG